ILSKGWVLTAPARPVKGGLLRSSQDPVPADAQRVGRDAEIDDDRLADDVRPRQEAPEAAVVGLVAVVAHHEVMPRGHHDRTPVVRRGMVMRRVPPDVVRQLPRADLRQAEIRLSRLLQQVQRVRLLQPAAVRYRRLFTIWSLFASSPITRFPMVLLGFQSLA